MKNPPKVSVLIRNLNEEEQLKILFSILDQQTYENFEVIFLDSGSSDNSLEFVKNYKSYTPLGEMLSFEEVAEAVFLITSDKFKNLTGQDITLDGGFTL